MARASEGKSQASVAPEIQLRSDGWERFKQAVHAAAKSGPKHRGEPTPNPKKQPASNGSKQRRPEVK
jgi:hypothetical protein